MKFCILQLLGYMGPYCTTTISVLAAFLYEWALSLCTKWKSCPLNSSADILHNTHLHASPSAEPRMISSYLSSAVFPNLSSKTVNWLIFALKTYAMSKKRGLQATMALYLHSSRDRPLLTAVFSCFQILPPTNKMKGAKNGKIGKSRKKLQFYWK